MRGCRGSFRAVHLLPSGGELEELTSRQRGLTPTEKLFLFCPGRKRSVTHTQLMHDKGRALQDFKRRMWLQELLDEVHTADIRELPVRSTGGSSAVGPGPGAISPISPSGTSGTSSPIRTSSPKPAGGTKNLSVTFKLEDEEGTNLPQETNKSTGHKEGGSMSKMPGKKKKKGRSGKRREGEKKRRRARSLAWLKREVGGGVQLEWRSLLAAL